MDAERRGCEGERQRRRRLETSWQYNFFQLHLIDPFQQPVVCVQSGMFNHCGAFLLLSLQTLKSWKRPISAAVCLCPHTCTPQVAASNVVPLNCRLATLCSVTPGFFSAAVQLCVVYERSMLDLRPSWRDSLKQSQNHYRQCYSCLPCCVYQELSTL